MRKTKPIKNKYQVKSDWLKSDQVQMLLAGSELIIANTIDYFDKQDTAFDDEYTKTVTWAFKYIDSFYDKLKDQVKIQKHIFNLAEKKYLLMLEKTANYEPNKLGFNLKNEREYHDAIYYNLISKSIKIFDALLNTMGCDTNNAWMHKYFKMLKIQMRSICLIFEREMGLCMN